MDIDQSALASQRLLHELLDAVPGELGLITRTIVYSGASPVSTLPDNHASDVPVSATISPSGPLGWAPRILALCCQAYGKPVELAIPVGACLELLGIVSYALDAVQDSHIEVIGEYTDHLRKDTAHLARDQYNTALVTNAGITIIGLAWQALLEHGPRYNISDSTIIEIGRLLAESWTSICHFQHLDLTLGRDPHLTLQEYDQIIEGKAGAIGGVAAKTGALLAAPADHTELWRILGTERTIAQQIWDDYKDLEEDIANGNQVSHPILYGLAVDDQTQREQLLTLLNQARSNGVEALTARRTLIQRLQQCGSVQYTHASLLLHLENARAALKELALPSNATDGLEYWISQVSPVFA